MPFVFMAEDILSPYGYSKIERINNNCDPFKILSGSIKPKVFIMITLYIYKIMNKALDFIGGNNHII